MPARLMELPVRLHVDGVARTEGDQLHVSPEPVDDPESPHPVAAQPPELVAERLAGVRIVENLLERGPDLALEHGVEAADERRDLVRDSHTTWGRHPAGFRRPYSNSSSRV